VEHEKLALVHLVVDELKKTFIDPLANLALDTGHVLEGLGDLALVHLLTLGDSGLLAAIMDASGLLDRLDDDLLGRLSGLLLLGDLLLAGLLDGLAGRALLGLAGGTTLSRLAGRALLGNHFGIIR